MSDKFAWTDENAPRRDAHSRLTFPLSLARFLITWGGLAIAMSLNGIARELLLKRLVSPPIADMLSAVLGALLIGLVTRIGFAALTVSRPSTGQLWFLSVVLVGLTVLFETALGRWVDHKSWQDLLRHYAIWRGEWWPLVLVWLALTPFVWARRWLRI